MALATLVIQQPLDASVPAWQWTVMAVSLGIIAVAIVIGAGAVAVAALKASRQLDRLSPALNELREDLVPALRSLRAITGRGEVVAQRVHEEAEAVLVTSRRIRKKVDAATLRAEERLGDLDALYEVVYDEVADTALGLAGALRTGRSVAGHARTLLRRAAAALVVVAVAALALPEQLHAWTPGTHVFIGQTILDNLALLPPALAALLRAHPLEYLYGSIAPDTSFAKDYAPVHRHSHHWHLGQEVHDRAEEDRLRAFGLGYLSHLAADTIAHNFYVPRQLAATALLKGLGHAYWEARFESHLGDRWAREARDLLRHDHVDADAHLDRIISPTLFSIPTNRRLFHGMVRLADRQAYRRAFTFARERSRHDIDDADVERHMAVSFEQVMRLLAALDDGPRRLDPTGAEALRLAKGMRRQALREGGRSVPKLIWDAAEAHFGLPRLDLGFWQRATRQPWVQAPTKEPWELLDDPGRRSTA